MEELKLEDLNFDSGDEVFDAFTAKPSAADDKGGASAATGRPADPRDEDNSDGKEITNPGDEGAAKSPESVVTEDKDNQGQAGKATDGAGGNSSSPKLNDSEQLYSKLASQFVDEGVLSDLDPNEIKSLSGINEAIQSEVTRRLTDTQKAIQEAMQAKAPVPEVAKVLNTINQLKSISEEQITGENGQDLQMNLIAQDFVNKGYAADRASVLAKRSIEAGTGVEDAKFALQAIIEHEQKRHTTIVKTAQDKETKSLNDIKDYVTGDSDIIPGIKLNAVQKQEIFDKMTTNIGNNQSEYVKARNENPVQMRVKVETIYHLTKGFSDFSIFEVKAASDAAKGIEDLLRGSSFAEDSRTDTNRVNDDNMASFTLADAKDLDFG